MRSSLLSEHCQQLYYCCCSGCAVACVAVVAVEHNGNDRSDTNTNSNNAIDPGQLISKAERTSDQPQDNTAYSQGETS